MPRFPGICGLGYRPFATAAARSRGQGGSFEAQLCTRPHVLAGRSLVVRSGHIICAKRGNPQFQHSGPIHTRNTRSDTFAGSMRESQNGWSEDPVGALNEGSRQGACGFRSRIAKVRSVALRIRMRILCSPSQTIEHLHWSDGPRNSEYLWTLSTTTPLIGRRLLQRRTP